MGQQVYLRIYATDPQRAATFYTKVFGWSLATGEGQRCWVITPSHDPRVRAAADEGITIPAVHVDDLDAVTQAAVAAGGEILVAPMPLIGAGWLACLADTEGNFIGVMRDDPDADWPSLSDARPLPAPGQGE
ncbi:VOC family protein [Dactylosporangium sp. NPDC049525]|uniref:VOC family protein n=1 Tax=Dactylosporangium sp. NPDC049525 TaxID=3154730 RepID=UPI003415B56E